MSASRCFRCLSRPSRTPSAPSSDAPNLRTRLAISPTPIACFSTTTTAAESANQSSGGISGHIRGGKRLILGKQRRTSIERAKAPGPGERKAWRKRIVLSNNSAIPVAGLKSVDARNLADPESVGTIMALPSTVQDCLRTAEAFKPTQTWGFFRQPSMLIRDATIEMATQLDTAARSKDVMKMVITGERTTGKSTVLLQALSYAYLNDWIVIHVPDAQELVMAATEYAPVPGTNPMQFMQNMYALNLLRILQKTHEPLLERLYSIKPHAELSTHVPVGSTLLQLAASAKEADGAWLVFSALWQELNETVPGRPPILFSLDGLQHVMRLSAYRSPKYEPIHAHDLALVRLFVDLLSGHEKLPNGGAVIGATTRNNAPRVPSVDLALYQRMALQAQMPEDLVPKRDPYYRNYDERVFDALKNVCVLPVGKLDKTEATALMEYWAASGLLRARVDAQLVTEKWAFAGNGNLGEMERAALLTMRL